MDKVSYKGQEPRRVSVFGSTGSVGCNTVSMLECNLDKYQIQALTGGSNIKLLAQQAWRLRPKMALVSNSNLYDELRRELSGSGVVVGAGEDAIVEAATMPADWIMASIVGMAGLAPTLAAIKQGGVVALANKECLVSAGVLFTEEVEKYGTRLLPVDSEHNGIFQIFDFDRPEWIEKIVLTASGGPFRSCNLEEMRNVTPDEALKHPNWSMGKKISIDSATLMNKGLERIEAFHLFPVTRDQIEIVVHPQSIVHSMVAYRDGSVLAQMGIPDMRMPIAHTLAWPGRIEVSGNNLDLCKMGQLTFESPSESRFPALRVAREALEAGGGVPGIMNAANEAAVEGFLAGRIGFLEIVEIVEKTILKLAGVKANSLEEVCEIDKESRGIAEEFIKC